MSTVTNEVLEVIRVMPGLNSGQILELMPHVKRKDIDRIVNRLYVSGRITRQPGPIARNGQPANVFFISDTGKPPMRQYVGKNGTPADAVFADMKKRVAELEQWKVDAIARFPDLAVDPIVIRARKIVAAELRATGEAGDCKFADEVMLGRRDSGLSMRLVIKMLEGEVA